MAALTLKHGHPHIISHGKGADYDRMQLIYQMQNYYSGDILTAITEAEIEIYTEQPTIH